MLKYIFDFFISLFLVLFTFPFLILIYIFTFYFMGSPVLYKQCRPGKNSNTFILYKFRTMLNLKDINGINLPDSKRMTKFGSFLRSTSLDELPSLFNVLIGDMSLVGPRPLLVEYLPLYNNEQSRRHDVKPGITGWAQVNGRNTLSWEDKFKLDVWYVDNQNFCLDLKILFLTIKKVFLKEGISSSGHVSMEPFTGSRSKDLKKND